MVWRIDELIGQRGVHELCYCSPPASHPLRSSAAPVLLSASHFGKLYRWDRDCSERVYFSRQAELMASIDQAGILPLVAAEQNGRQSLLVFPRLHALRLDVWLAEQSQAPPRAVQLAIIRQLLEALEAIHHHGYTHGTVRPEHLLIGPAEKLTLVGLGGCEEVGQWTCLPRLETRYDAPEMCRDEFEASSAQDVFATAEVIAQLLGPAAQAMPIIGAMQSQNPNDRPSTTELISLFHALELELFGSPAYSPAPPAAARRAA